MKITRDIARCLWPPALFCQADSVFACDHTAPPQHLGKKIVERAFDFFAHSRIAIVSIGHDVDMNIAVPGVTEAGNRESVLCLQAIGEFHEIYEMTARHDHVFVQFR